MDARADMSALDGNAAAGALGELFGFDLTVAVTTCAACHDRHAMAELRAYLQAPGMVLRCVSCGAVQMRVVRGADRAWIDLRGVTVVEVHADSSSPGSTGPPLPTAHS